MNLPVITPVSSMLFLIFCRNAQSCFPVSTAIGITGIALKNRLWMSFYKENSLKNLQGFLCSLKQNMPANGVVSF